jgi:hypothetical protein
MRIVLAMPSTGVAFFPGLARPVVIEVARLPPEEAQALADCLAAARFFDRPEAEAAPPRPPGAADCRCWAVTVEDEGRSRTLEVPEPITDPALARLIELLEAIARTLRGR